MPPGPAYNWFCAAHAVADILGNAARIRAAQLDARTTSILPRQPKPKPRRRAVEENEVLPIVRTARPTATISEPLTSVRADQTGPSVPRQSSNAVEILAEQPTVLYAPPTESVVENIKARPEPVAPVQEPPKSPSVEAPSEPAPTYGGETPITGILEPRTITVEVTPPPSEAHTAEPTLTNLPEAPSRKLQSSKVPASRIGRLLHYGGKALAIYASE